VSAPVPEHPNLPRRGALALMFVGIALAGILGGLIGYGVVHASCNDTPTHAERLFATMPGFHASVSSCDWKLFGAAVIGTLLTSIGAAVVAVLMMRAQSEWRAHAPSRGEFGETPPRT
jgi:hypothetical protein